MDELDDFMLFNVCEDEREEQERSSTSEYPYQKQFFQPSGASDDTINHRDDELSEGDGRNSSPAHTDGSSTVSSGGGNRSRLGCFLFVIIAIGVISFFLFGNIVKGCRGNNDDACVADSDSIEEVCTIASDPEDTVTSLPEGAASSLGPSSNASSTYSTGYSDEDEYDEDGMYKDEDEDIKEKREYDDYDDDEADDWE